MFAHRQRDCPSYSRVFLQRARVLYSVQAAPTANPEIAIERGPKSRLHVVAQVSFECENRVLCLGITTRRNMIAREEVMVGGEEPHGSVGRVRA